MASGRLNVFQFLYNPKDCTFTEEALLKSIEETYQEILIDLTKARDATADAAVKRSKEIYYADFLEFIKSNNLQPEELQSAENQILNQMYKKIINWYPEALLTTLFPDALPGVSTRNFAYVQEGLTTLLKDFKPLLSDLDFSEEKEDLSRTSPSTQDKIFPNIWLQPPPKKSLPPKALPNLWLQAWDETFDAIKFGKRRSWIACITGWPSFAPGMSNGRKFFLGLCAVLAMPLTIIRSILFKPFEFLTKAGEVYGKQNNNAWAEHGFGVLSSFIRYTTSFNPVQSIKEAMAPDARPARWFGPKYGPIIGGVLAGIFSIGGIIATAFLGPVLLSTIVGEIGGSAAAAAVTSGMAGADINAMGSAASAVLSLTTLGSAGTGLSSTAALAATFGNTFLNFNNPSKRKKITPLPEQPKIKAATSIEELAQRIQAKNLDEKEQKKITLYLNKINNNVDTRTYFTHIIGTMTINSIHCLRNINDFVEQSNPDKIAPELHFDSNKSQNIYMQITETFYNELEDNLNEEPSPATLARTTSR